MASFLKSVAVLLLVGVLLIIYQLGAGELRPREASLLSIILFIFSILATWIFSHFYAESSHSRAIQEIKELSQSNLRTYALKAAEKVNNLSKQLNVLVVYLQQELDATDYESPSEELLVKEERLEAAIQMINALKSVNDTALSDWQGVIGEELGQQKRAREEQEQNLRRLWEQYLELEKGNLANKSEDASKIHSEIESVKDQLSVLAKSVLGGSIRVRRPKPIRQDVQSDCPVCGVPLKYRQRPHGRSLKTLTCPSCHARLFSRFEGVEGFKIQVRRNISQKYTCPACQAEGQSDVDNLPGACATIECQNCHKHIRVVRGWDELKVINPGEVHHEDVGTMSEELIKAVQGALPPQPWPKGTSHRVAANLGLTHSAVNQAITELIRRGALMPQIDGRLYSPMEGKGPPSSHS